MPLCKRVLVALELNDLDSTTIRWAGMISRLAQAEELWFVHVAQTTDLPAEIRAKHPELAETPRDVAKRQIADRVQRHFDGYAQTTVQSEIIDGAPITELLRHAQEHDTDLVLLGRTGAPVRPGQLPERMARKASCSVLIVPEQSEPRIKSILVATDFSAHSGDALDAALHLAQAAREASVNCIHAFRVPPGYERTGATYEEFAEEMRRAAVRSYDSFVGDHNRKGVPLTPDFVLTGNSSHAIVDAVERNQDDLAVVGAQGRNATPAVRLGHIPEHLVWITKVPLLVVRNKGGLLLNKS